MSLLVEIKNLKKRYPPAPGAADKEGLLAVKGVSFQINKGEIFSLLGPNGAGKTTTISMMSGLLAPTEGDVMIGGYSITQNPVAVKKLIGVVPQEIALYPELSARANLEFFGRLYGMGGAALRKRVDEVLDFIDLKDRQKERIDTFSGGMKRRVNIGVGLLHKPALVFMDEPTVGVDPQSRRSILDAVKNLNGEGMSVLYTTHYMEEAEELSDRVGIIDHGSLIALGTKGELIQRIGEQDAILLKVGEDNAPKVCDLVANMPGVSGANVEEDKVRLLAGRGRQTLPAVLKLLDDAGLLPTSIQIIEPNLESVFLHMTGRALRD